MKEGKELVQGTPRSLRSYTKQNMLRITFSNVQETKKHRNALKSTGLIKFTTVRDNSIFVGIDDSRTAFTSVNKWLLEHNVEFNAIVLPIFF